MADDASRCGPTVVDGIDTVDATQPPTTVVAPQPHIYTETKPAFPFRRTAGPLEPLPTPSAWAALTGCPVVLWGPFFFEGEPSCCADVAYADVDAASSHDTHLICAPRQDCTSATPWAGNTVCVPPNTLRPRAPTYCHCHHSRPSGKETSTWLLPAAPATNAMLSAANSIDPSNKLAQQHPHTHLCATPPLFPLRAAARQGGNIPKEHGTRRSDSGQRAPAHAGCCASPLLNTYITIV